MGVRFFIPLLSLFLFVATSACDRGANRVKEEEAVQAKAQQLPLVPKPADFGDMLVDGSIGDASNLIPFLSGDSASSAVEGNIFATLLRTDKDFNLRPYLAKSWDISADTLTITFHLRDDVKWHDGVPFTADDLLFQYTMMIHPAVPSAYKETFLLLQKAEAPDPFTFVVTFKEPYSPGLRRIGGMTGLPKHLLKNTQPVDLIKSPLARKPVGNGPYVFSAWKTQESITLTANPDHFEGRPLIARLHTRIIPDSATQFLELKAGSLDTMALQPLHYLKQTDSEFFRKNYNKYKYLSNGYTYLGYNLKKQLFRDKRVRQALTYAINKQEIIDGVLFGLGQAATGPIKPHTWAFNPAVKKYPYSPEKAKALLAEAGWSDSDGDGVLDKGGKPFAFTIVTNQGNALRKKTGEIIQQRLKGVGIDVELRILEWSSFINSFINKRKFDACILGWSLGAEPDQYDIWHSSKTGEHEFNFVSYKNDEVDALLDQARKTFDQKERTRLYHRFQKILAEEQPYTFLYIGDALPIVSSRVRGIVPGAAGIGYNSDKWFIKKRDHKHSVAP